jgi:hypothetical protein
MTKRLLVSSKSIPWNDQLILTLLISVLSGKIRLKPAAAYHIGRLVCELQVPFGIKGRQ